MPDKPRTIVVATREEAGQRLDQFLVSKLPDVSRARVQHLISEGKVVVNGQTSKPSYKLHGNEHIEILGPLQAPPLRATPEDIPLDIVYEDDDLAVINKPAGMMVHAGAGDTDDARNQGTLVNALLHRFGSLSKEGGELRPGIVHRLDKTTSGLIVVAKNNHAHRHLASQFASRQTRKMYLALVHGSVKQERGTIQSKISRDRIRRTRMTTRQKVGREAITHYLVRRRLNGEYGKFTLLELKIDTGRTHQIRVHLASIGHPVVGDTLYGAPRALDSLHDRTRGGGGLSLPRNFLHSTALEFAHPRTGQQLSFSRPLPVELEQFLEKLQQP